ncbi:MAG: type II secretion system F family protein [Candidatus Dojkabacteria bacterium]
MIIKISETKTLYLFHKVSPLDIALSIRHLSIMLKTGLAIEDAIQVLSEQTADDKLREIYTKMLKDVRSGMTMAESMQEHKKVFSKIIISIINVGEQGATLEKNLLFLADYLKKNYELQRKVKGALVYPIIVFGITVIEMLGVIFFILPKLESLFSAFENTSTFTITILGIAAFIRTNGLLLVIILITLGFTFSRFLGTKPGKRFSDWFQLKVPVLKKLNKNNIITSFSRTLGILLESGIPIEEAMKIASGTMGNGIYEKVLIKAYKNLKKGKDLADSLSKHPSLFPPTYVKMIEIGEQTGSLEDNLNYLYEFYAEEVQDMSNNLTTLLEPLLLIFIGIMIGLLALTIIAPIYQLTGTIRPQ